MKIFPREYFIAQGRRGGKSVRNRRKLTSAEARRMVQIREARKASITKKHAEHAKKVCSDAK